MIYSRYKLATFQNQVKMLFLHMTASFYVTKCIQMYRFIQIDKLWMMDEYSYSYKFKKLLVD